MKKIIAFATLALGVILGTAGTVNAYPPTATPTISGAQTVAPGASFTITVSDAPAGSVEFSFEGETQSVSVLPAGAAFVPLQVAGGAASATFTAPMAAGTYPVSATLSDGATLTTTVTVEAAGDGTGNGAGSGSGSGAGSGAGKGGGLPATGGAVLSLVGLGLAAVAGGFGLVYVSKRRRALA